MLNFYRFFTIRIITDPDRFEVCHRFKQIMEKAPIRQTVISSQADSDWDLSSEHLTTIIIHRTVGRLSKPAAGWLFVFDTKNNKNQAPPLFVKNLESLPQLGTGFLNLYPKQGLSRLKRQDVVDFLSYLAVEKQVSAASQN